MKAPPCQAQPGAPAVEPRRLTRCFNGFVAVDRLDLANGADQLVLEYSHGVKKKLGLAMALMGQPEVLLQDKPFEGVDPVLIRGIRDLLRQFVERGRHRVPDVARPRNRGKTLHTSGDHRP
ncbi:hypothetical protein [Limisphaera sp. 4302-co]|uniref:hypothetical protein n=1 Tax=Limisphaera sp. 4302-co TaxID=3400417 RepID=UPI003C1DB887